MALIYVVEQNTTLFYFQKLLFCKTITEFPQATSGSKLLMLTLLDAISFAIKYYLISSI